MCRGVVAKNAVVRIHGCLDRTLVSAVRGEERNRTTAAPGRSSAVVDKNGQRKALLDQPARALVRVWAFE